MNPPTRTDWAAIRDEWSKAQQMGFETVRQLAKVGAMLIEQQGDMSQREFARVVGDNVPGMSRATIQRLQTLACHQGVIEDQRPDSLREALVVIQAHNRPPPVTDSRVNHLALEGGPRVSHPTETNSACPTETARQMREEIRAELEAEAEQELKRIRAALNDAWRECRAMQERLNERAKGVNAFMTYREWKMLIALVHPDKYEGLGLSDTHKQKLTEGFRILQRLKAAVEPLTPIKVLREQGWEDIAPAYKRRRAQR